MTTLFLRAESCSIKAGRLSALCLTVAPMCLNTKTAREERKRGKKPCCPYLAFCSIIISIVGAELELREPAWLAGLWKVHRVGKSSPQACSGRLSPLGFRWQHCTCLWCSPLCSRFHCLSRCLHHLNYKSRAKQKANKQKITHQSISFITQNQL